MFHSLRFILVLAALGGGGASTFVAAGVQAPPNVLEIVVVNGPLAGTYKPPVDDVICLYEKKRQVFVAGSKSFDVHDAKVVAEAGFNVFNPYDAGAKYGFVRIAFGDPDKNPTVYSTDRVPVTLTVKGKGVEIEFQGKTKDGIQLRMTAKCLDVEEIRVSS